MNDKTEQTVTDALRRAFSLGKTYCQQAHSDFISQHVKADATRAKFQELCERTEDTIDTLRAQLAEAQRYAERYRSLRRGQKWSVIDWKGDALRADDLDAAIDAGKGESNG